MIAILLIVLIAFSLLFSLPLAFSASPPEPTYGTATVDGNTAEWNLNNDFFANMYRAGDSTKPLESKAYLRYDCSSQTLFVLVLTEPGVPAVVSAGDAWAAINTISNKTYNGNDDGGALPNFAWVNSNGTYALGYEAAFNLAQGNFTIIIHIQVYDDNATQTSATVGSPKDGIPLVINCPPANPAIQVNKLISTDNASWNEANLPPGIAVTAGSNVYYQFIVTNIGNVELTNLTLTDNTYTLTNLNIPGALAPNASFTYYLGPIQAQVGQHTNTATATGDYNNTTNQDTDDANYNATPAPNPAINIIKQISTDNSTWVDADSPPGIAVTAGSNVYYKFVVTNIGNVELFNITLTDNMYSLGAIPPSSLTPNASYTSYFGPVTAQSGQQTNTATATGDYNNTTYNDTDNANYNATQLPVPMSSINVVKEISTDNSSWSDANSPPGLNIAVGSNVFYRFTVTNTGNTTLENLTLTDNTYTLSPSLPLTLSPNQTYVYYFGPVAALLGQHTNIATATGDYNGTTYNDTNPANYYGIAADSGDICIKKYISTNRCTWYDANCPPGLTVLAGKCIYYKIVIKNTGNVTLSNITLTDTAIDTTNITIPSTLQPGKSFTVILGPIKANILQQTNNATATGTYQNTTYTDSDTANYYGAIRTYTACDYRGTGAAGKLLTCTFQTAFSNGLEIGCYTDTDGFGYNWTSVTSLKSFLRYTATSTLISCDKLNPTSLRYGGGTLAVQTAVLSLNIAFQGSSSNMPEGLGGGILYIKEGDSLSGKTIPQILSAANDALGGHELPQGYTYNSLKNLIEHINTAFDDATPNDWAKTYLRINIAG